MFSARCQQSLVGSDLSRSAVQLERKLQRSVRHETWCAPSQAQAHAFEDTWKWGKDAQRALDQTAERHLEAWRFRSDAFQKVFAGSDMEMTTASLATPDRGAQRRGTIGVLQ